MSAALSRTQRETPEQFAAHCQALRERLQSEDFLSNRGLGNEVGFFTFCYDPARELQMRVFIDSLVSDAQSGALPCRIVQRNLYDLLLKVCEDKRILNAIPKQEEKRGTQALLAQLQKVATPEAFAAEIDYADHQPGCDVVFMTGVGEVYPVIRVHSLLENLHKLLDDVPCVIFYPGTFTGESFRLLTMLDDGNYYRAFNI